MSEDETNKRASILCINLYVHFCIVILPSHHTCCNRDAINFATRTYFSFALFIFESNTVRLIVTWRRLSREYVRSFDSIAYDRQCTEMYSMWRIYYSLLPPPLQSRENFIYWRWTEKKLMHQASVSRFINIIECWHKISFWWWWKKIFSSFIK